MDWLVPKWYSRRIFLSASIRYTNWKLSNIQSDNSSKSFFGLIELTNLWKNEWNVRFQFLCGSWTQAHEMCIKCWASQFLYCHTLNAYQRSGSLNISREAFNGEKRRERRMPTNQRDREYWMDSLVWFGQWSPYWGSIVMFILPARSFCLMCEH